MSETSTALQGLTLDEMPWRDPEHWPPTDLPYDDGGKMESPWHFRSTTLLLATYIAARGGIQTDYFIGTNMFLYYSERQARNQDFKGPDVFIVKDVDGQRERLSWMVWAEDGRSPDVIIELLSSSTEEADLGSKKQLYERTLRVPEYFCIAPGVERLLGWRLTAARYQPIAPDERGWLWSEQLDLWLGPWAGSFLAQQAVWPRFYHPDGGLVLLPEEAEKQRADSEQQRAETEQQRADSEQQRAEAEQQRAEAEKQRAETEQQRADSEQQRADELATELERLRAELARLQGGSGR